MASTTEEKPRGPGRPKGQKKTGGRQKGTPNKLGTSIAEVFRNLMGLDDEAVERTAKIDGKGYRCRRRLFEMLHGERNVDPAFTNLLKTCLAYGFGTPRRMEPDQASAFARRMAFITARGLPWEQDPLAKRESLMIQQQETEAALQLEMKKAEAAKPASPEGTVVDGDDQLQLVRNFDLKEP